MKRQGFSVEQVRRVLKVSRSGYYGWLERKPSKRRGKLRRQELEIYYSFVGQVELPES